MPKFKVTVQKYMYASGVVTIDAPDAQAAEAAVQSSIQSRVLEMDTINWDDPVYEAGTFETTGDVEPTDSKEA